ncbi:hypothetical protein H0H87_009726 [Tephrocybe sp. NHM501043]|nr:hypothetical protein H0H87_009726 [Tephrocybe sp. NHM501043]
MYSEAGRRPRTARERERERRLREEREATDILARSIDKRRWIYQHDLYAKHVASNSYTRYRPYPTPAQFAASNDLISKTTTFLRRELQVWDDLDVEFLTTFTISVMKSIDIRSESAVKLLAEFLDMDAPYVEGGRHLNAEHFAHDTCGTSRRHIEAVKGKEHAESAFEINLPNAGKASVAQPSFEFETAAPPPPIRPSTARPPRSGHRSLLQSVQTHLKQGANYHHVGGFKGTGSERHRDALLLAHDSASPPALLARSLGVTSASGARREKRGSDFTASTLSQSIAIRHPEPPSDNEIHIPTSQPTKVSSVEMIARAQRRMAPTASEPRVSETKKNLSSPAPPSNNDRDVPGGSAVLRTRGMVELPLNLKTAAHSELNPTISPPTTPSVGDRATTPPSQFHALPTSNSSENLSHHEAAADIHHMGISQQDNTINGLRPSKSAHANIEISDSTHEPASSGSRKKLLARLQSERLHARGEEKGSAALASTGSDRTSQFAGVDRRGSSSPQSEQISNTSVVDPHVVEAKLRRRAQLQVRLAAEKRRTYI